MDKQKQIEEMVLVVYPWLKEIPIEERKQLSENVSGLMVVERLYNAGYRKIPENAVVLTEEELFARDENIHKADREYIKALEECINNRNAKVRKETAEKFAPLRKYMWDRFHHYHDIRNKAEADYKKCKDENGKAVLNNDYHRADAIMFILGKVLIEFDEICKEITEGEV